MPIVQVSCESQGQRWWKIVNELCKACFQSRATLGSACLCSKPHTVGLGEAPPQRLLCSHSTW